MMSSRDPDELREELESIDFSGDVGFLTELRAEARETVESQSDTLADIDTKASRILRLNILLIGVLVSVLSIASQNGSEESASMGMDPLVNPFIYTGVGALVLSTAFSALTYTASELDVGVSSENVTNLLRADFSRQEAEALLVKNYVMRINFNRSTNVRNIPLIQMTIFLVIVAVVFFTLGAYDAVVGTVPGWISGSAIVLLLLIVVLSGLPKQLLRAVRDVLEWR